KRGRLLVCAAVTLAACGASPAGSAPDASTQATSDADATHVEPYSYPGCAPEDYNCERLLTFYCAVKHIRAKYDGCESASDCVRGSVDADWACTGGLCGFDVVNAAHLEAYASELRAESARYCASTTCIERAGCVQPGPPACVRGRCVASYADAG
ncbi:MAG: hypothetical protein ACK4N5_21515, partial [Myxococcales bacterium]